MKALVTGAAGFVGRHLCPKLEAAGYKVSRSDVDWGATPLGPIPALLRSIDAKADWAPHDFDVIVHLAANIVNVDARMKRGLAAYDDIALDLEFLKWVEKNPPSKALVLMSSCAVDYPDDPYCVVKRNLECFAKTLVKKGLPVIVLRPFSGYGEDQSEEYPFRAILERALRKENPLTVWGGNQVRDWIHVDDLTDAILFVIERQQVPRYGLPVEVGTGIGTSLRDLAAMISSQTNPEHWLEGNHRLKLDQAMAIASARRVAGESDFVMLQHYGWMPKITLIEGIGRAVVARKKEMLVSA